MKNTKNAGGALAPWLLAVAISGAVLGATMVSLPEPEKRSEGLDDIRGWKQYRDTERALRKIPPNRRPPWIVAMGTSLSRCAFADQKQVHTLGAEAGLSTINFTPLLRNGEKESARFIPLYDRLRDDPPDVVIIEEGLLLWHDIRLETGGIFAVRDQLLQMLRDALGMDDENNWLPLPAGKAAQKKKDDFLARVKELRRNIGGPGPIPELQTEGELILLETRKNQWTECPSHIPDTLERLLQTAAARGTTVVALDIMGSPTAREKFPRRLKTCAAKITSQLETDYGLVHLVYPAPDDLNFYSDFSHMNQEGRERFLKWLMPRIKKLLDERGRQ